MAISDEKLSEFDDALASLGKADSDVSELMQKIDASERVDLSSVDDALDTLGEAVGLIDAKSTLDADQGELEVLDHGDDFVLLVDEEDLEQLESSGTDVPGVSTPPPIPGESEVPQAETAEGEGNDEEEGFFQKLFGTRRSSNRP